MVDKLPDKTVPAAFGLNRVLWASIVNQEIITGTNNYGGLIPIIPTQEEPQFIAAMDKQDGIMSFPYIVYSWYSNNIDANSWYKQTDTVTYTVYAIDQAALRKLVLLIVDLFKRYDDSAQMVNAYLNQAGPEAGWLGANESEYHSYNYNYIYVSSATSGTPSAVENDPTKATVTLRVNYTDTRNDTGLIVPPVPQ